MGLRGVQKGTHGKYSDLDDGNWMPVVHKDKRYLPRAYIPPNSHDPAPYLGHSRLAEESLNGDWSFKPERNNRIGDGFIALRGTPPGPAESRERGPEPGAHFYGPHDEDVWDFQQRAIAAHREAGDYRRHVDTAYA